MRKHYVSTDWYAGRRVGDEFGRLVDGRVDRDFGVEVRSGKCDAV